MAYGKIISKPYYIDLKDNLNQVWSANLDFSPVFDFYGIISYVADYYMKVRNFND